MDLKYNYKAEYEYEPKVASLVILCNDVMNGAMISHLESQM